MFLSLSLAEGEIKGGGGGGLRKVPPLPPKQRKVGGSILKDSKAWNEARTPGRTEVSTLGGLCSLPPGPLSGCCETIGVFSALLKEPLHRVGVQFQGPTEKWGSA